MKLTKKELTTIRQLLNISKELTTDETLTTALTELYNHLGLESIEYKDIIKDIKAKYLILECTDNGDLLWYERDATSYSFINENKSEALKQWELKHSN